MSPLEGKPAPAYEEPADSRTTTAQLHYQHQYQPQQHQHHHQASLSTMIHLHPVASPSDDVIEAAAAAAGPSGNAAKTVIGGSINNPFTRRSHLEPRSRRRPPSSSSRWRGLSNGGRAPSSSARTEDVPMAHLGQVRGGNTAANQRDELR